MTMAQLSPEKTEEAVRALVEPGGPREVFMPAAKMRAYMQSLPPDEAARRAREWGVETQIAEPRAAADDVAIATETYLTRVHPVAGKQFGQDIRLERDGMSLREARAFDQTYAQLAGEAGKGPGVAGDTAPKAAAPTRRIYDDMQRQARAAGFARDEARQYAALLASHYAARAARRNDDPWALYRQDNIEIRRAVPDVLRDLSDSDLDALIDAVRQGDSDTTKSRRSTRRRSLPVAAGGRGAAGPSGSAQEALRATLSRLGIDVGKATNKEIRAALRKDGAHIQRKYEQAFRPRAFVEFGRRLALALAGQLPPKEVLKLGHTPEALQLAGAPDLLLIMRQDTAVKVAHGKHAVPVATLERMPDLLQRPVMVFDSATAPEALVAVIDATDREGNPIVVSVKKAAGDLVVNRVTSVYGKSRDAWFADQIVAGRLRYLDRTKAPGWSAKTGVQFPGWDQLSGTAAPEPRSQGWPELSGLQSPAAGQQRGAAPLGSGKKIATEADLGKGPDRDYRQPSRARIEFLDDRTVITLFESHDLSSLLHEAGHLWLEGLRRDAGRPDAPADVKADLARVEKFLGMQPGAVPTVAQHEAFARAAEAYLREGRAPSAELAGAFARFRTWLRAIYRRARELDVKLDPEIRGVFDRLLATPEQIARADGKRAPSRSKVRRDYWKSRARTASDRSFSSKDLERMRKGQPPLHESVGVPMELHHIVPRHRGGSDDPSNLMEVWPWEHEKIDQHRHYRGPRPEDDGDG